MKFKKDKGQQDTNLTDWRNLSLYPSVENMELRKLVEMIDRLSKDSGHGEITITSYIRKNNKKSLHYYGRAVDIRVRDKPVEWYIALCSIGVALAALNPKWRINPHYELYSEPEKHVHLEVRS